MVYELIDSYNKQKLSAASKHRNGAGIETGVDFNTTLLLFRPKKFGKDYQKKTALETVMAGATWPKVRINQSYPDVSALCDRCGLHEETDLHVFWHCPCNDSVDDNVRDSDKYKDRAIADAGNVPCLWLRGILPIKFTHLSKEDIPNRRAFIPKGEMPQLGQWPSGTYYGDGSGGINTRFPTIRRCGCSLASCINGKLDLGVRYALPGETRTVPRAELSALASLVEISQEGSTLLYIGDDKPVCNLFHKGSEFCKKTSNAYMCYNPI